LAHSNTIMHQMLKIFSRHEFESLAKKHHQGQKLRRFNRWSQFVAMMYAQISSRLSLRDIASNMTAQSKKSYHLGVKSVSKSTLARVNEKQPYELYESLFTSLLTRCKSIAPKHRFRFKNKLYSLDATTIDLCLNVFPWADFRKTKGGIKLHVGMDHEGYLPSFVSITEARFHESKWSKLLKLPKGSITIFDRAFNDYSWYNHLTSNGIFFVTRLKKNACFSIVERRQVQKKKGLTCDQTIGFTGVKADQCSRPLRRIGYRDPETGKHYVFLTNAFHLSAKTIADIYKERWQIELFFKWIKQNLKIKTFLGTSRNAVMTQIWIALCVYLLLAYIKFLNRLKISMQQILRLLQLNLFEQRPLLELLKPPSPNKDINMAQLELL